VKKIKVVLWDFDGTLLDSTRESMENMIFIAEKLGLRAPSVEILQKYWGMPWLEFLDEVARECKWQKGIKGKFLDKCRENKHLWRSHKLFEGTNNTLKILISKKIKVGIVSSRVKESVGKDLFSIMDYFKKLEINTNMFFIIQGREDCSYVKPNPRVLDSVIEILRKDGIGLDEIVYVGDTIHDFNTASKHIPKISFVAVVSGACDSVIFLQEKVSPECIIDSPAGIFESIKFLENL